MKKFSLLISAILLFNLFVACNPNNSPSRNDPDKIATIVAGTLAAIPTPTSVSQIPSLSLANFPDKVLLGEDESYSVYLINSNNADSAEKTGEIIIYDKGKDLVYQIVGYFSFFATTKVSNDGKGEYVFLSDGSYSSRGATIISLNDKKQAVNKFCTSGKYVFWKDYVIFNNCDIFKNRPWGVGEAPSITAINLKTGVETVIAKSDLTHQYSVNQIEGDLLRYAETYVENEADWQSQDKQKTDEKIYNLASLSNN